MYIIGDNLKNKELEKMLEMLKKLEDKKFIILAKKVMKKHKKTLKRLSDV